MTLSELLEEKFRGDVRFRGAAYLKAERVAVTRVTQDRVLGIVRDGVEYQTQLAREGNALKLYCSCAGGRDAEAACKHLWATILAVDEGGYVSGTLKPGYIPPFAAEEEAFDPHAELLDDDLTGDVYLPTPRATRPHGATAERMRPWEAQLDALRQDMSTDEPQAGNDRREREVFYEIDVEQSRSAGQLVVNTSQRQRRSNGQWGKLKSLKLRPGRLDDVEHEEDRRILAYLSGGMPDRGNSYLLQAQAQASAHRYRVPTELCELILPLMCATGRVRYFSAHDRSRPEPIEWDDAPPWELGMRIEKDAQEKHWRLVGFLRRGDEHLSLSETVLLVPGGLVLTRSKVARLEDFDAFAWVPILERAQPLSVPAGEDQELVDSLLDMPALPQLELPDELRLEEVRCEPTCFLTIRSPRGPRWNYEWLAGEVEFDYMGTKIPGSSPRWAIVQRGEGRCIVRDRAREEAAWAQLHEHGFRRRLGPKRDGHAVEVNARELGPAVRALSAAGWEVRADGKQVRRPGEINFRIKSGIDWFELHADIDFEGHTVTFPELLSALARGDSTVRLDDGSLGIVPEDWARRFGLLAGLGTDDTDHVRFAHNQVALLDALLATQSSVDYDQQFLELRDKFESFRGVVPVEEPVGFEGQLRGYQREGLGWLDFLQQFRLGGCLADDMGLGKTIQFLALLLQRRKDAKVRIPSLVVVPKSLMFNWRHEAERFTPQLKILDYSGLDRERLRNEITKHDLVLTTYGTLRRDALALKDISFDYIVLDEAQTIKNAGSQVAKAARLLKAQHRVALTGTPIENHVGDLWSIFEFLNPGILGRSSIFKMYAADAENHETRRLLSQGLKPFILRRTKEDVASELPEKLEQTIFCEMGKSQTRLYAELRDGYRASLMGLIRSEGFGKTRMHVLEALLRLRQAACHPALLGKSTEDDSSAKLDVLVPHLQELIEEGHKALVFSQFTSLLAIVKRHLDRRHITYEYLDGQTRDRRGRVERFQSDPDCGAFLISLKAGGFGLNLTAADYVFLLDPWWNPAVEAQAIDRAHRLGQTRQVFAYRLICRDTVEEKITELQTKKRQLADAILEADSRIFSEMSTEDLEMLLS